MRRRWVWLAAAWAVVTCLWWAAGCGPARSRVPVAIGDLAFTYACRLDGEVVADRAVVYGSDQDEVIIFHRGRGFAATAYERLWTAVARRGVTVVSVDDPRSFAGSGTASPRPDYDQVDPVRGVEAASCALEAARAAAVRAGLGRRHIWLAGHSRGGGAVEFAQARGVPADGYVYLAAFDVVAFGATVPLPLPGRALVVAATLDGDLGFPLTVGLASRCAAPTLAVILGGNHNYITDFALPNAAATIDRTTEQAEVEAAILAFAGK